MFHRNQYVTRYLAVGLLSASLMGCAYWQQLSGGSSDPAVQVLNAAKKADGLAHNLHQAAAEAVDAVAPLLPADKKAQAAKLLADSEDWLVKADKAIALGDASTATADLAQAAPLTAQAQAIASQH